MRGLRITPNGLDNIDVTTSNLQLSIRVLMDGCIAIKWVNLGSKVQDVDAEIFGYIGEKKKKFTEFESIVIVPRETNTQEGSS